MYSNGEVVKWALNHYLYFNLNCIFKSIFSNLHVISLQQLCKTVKFSSETDSRQSCSDSALSVCRRILPGDRSCRTQWMIHCVSDCLESAQRLQQTLLLLLIFTWMLQSHLCTQFMHKDRCNLNLFWLNTTFQAAALICELSYSKPHDRKYSWMQSWKKSVQFSVSHWRFTDTCTNEEKMLHIWNNGSTISTSFCPFRDFL